VNSNANAKGTHSQSSRALPRRGAREGNQPGDVAHERRLCQVRALQLGRLLRHQGVRVAVNDAGDHVDLVYEQGGGRADKYGDSDMLRPIMIRVGRRARDEDVLAEGGPRGIFGRYNKAISKLRELRTRVMAIVGRGALTDSSLIEAHRALSSLDELVRHRRAKYMPNGVARLAVLRHEIIFFETRHSRLLPILSSAEAGAAAAGAERVVATKPTKPTTTSSSSAGRRAEFVEPDSASEPTR